ncbi:I78 family peptidase inhibitor [Sulfitobacter aestuariivivens]|uniref:Peptidase inhibitor I78 n=1 Tax=Sulfitobacter aestuariivivens TaxID=2766981 RepID=A0A927D7K9_9RHOB|nr:I78 family peptidase inhibitor [Sulfitobacter aestuariivivens]MBD3665623.1 hypothetical protein [Sulfitobacter aestuariivivens]
MRGLLMVLLLAGCTGAAPSPDITCNAQNWQELIGEPEEALYATLGNLRVVRAGKPKPADVNPNRLNAEIDKDGRIARFGCY